LKPTIFPSVPRLYNKIYGILKGRFEEATGMKGWLVNKAITTKLENYRNGDGLTHFLYDTLVFGKTK